jgi:hypothetical protein
MDVRYSHWLLAALLTVAVLSGCATVVEKRPPPPSLEEVVQMSKAGVPAHEIVARLVYTRAAYAVKGSELARLKEQGVADEVLDYIQESALALARAEEAYRQGQYYYWYGWPYWGPGPYPYYPYYWWYRYPPPPPPPPPSPPSPPRAP